jgi:hypothetical protein
MAELKCDYCGEEIVGEPVRRGSRSYCTEACAFEDTRSKDCGGRTDSVSAPGIVDLPGSPETTKSDA